MSVLLIVFAVVLPVVMVLAGNWSHDITWCYYHITGALQFDDCPYMNRGLLYCVVFGGIILGLLTCLRFSICCVYYLGSDGDKRANSCSKCLCCLEGGFFLLVIGYLSILGIASYLTFADPPDNSCPEDDPNCDDKCDTNVYQLLTVLLWIQFAVLLLFLMTLCTLLMGVKWCCCVHHRSVRIS